jgi:phage gp46-like protein
VALQFTGSDVALVRDEATGRYDLAFSTSGPNKGNPILTSDGTHAVLTTLLSKKRGVRGGSPNAEGGYFGDPSGRRGTLIWTISQDKLATPSQLKAYAEDGGQQLLDRKMIGSFTASAVRVAPGKFRLNVTWTTPSGSKVPTLSVLG